MFTTITADSGGVMGGKFMSFVAFSSEGSDGIDWTRSGSTGGGAVLAK